MTKEHILDEIRRTAAENGGKPLGIRTFESSTGIRHGDWFGRYWRSWGDAVREAGLEANTLTAAIAEDELLERYALLARDLGRAPVKGDLKLAKRREATFPSEPALVRRFGSYPALRARALTFCSQRPGFEDLLPLLAPRPTKHAPDAKTRPTVADGFVYLLRSGRYYKIGKTNSSGRRERELQIQLPERADQVHAIKTDDPDGIEDYWHRRFAEKRAHGEWFRLDAADVVAFKRRRFQ